MSSSSQRASIVGLVQASAPDPSRGVAITFARDGVEGEEQLTYAELHELTRKVSALLGERAAAAARGLLPELNGSVTIDVDGQPERRSGMLYQPPMGDDMSAGARTPQPRTIVPVPVPALSIVVPAYRSEDCLDELASRIRRVMATTNESYELILVNDGSPDRTGQVIERLGAVDPAVVAIQLRKNFGQDNAIMAGLNVASGDVIVIMDDDLQHDPEDIPRLVAKLHEGYDVVYASYEKRHQSTWKNVGSWFNGKVAEVVLDKPRDVYLSPFKAIDRCVVADVVQYRGPYPYVDGLLFRTTANMTQIEVQQNARFAGRSTYTFWKSVAVWAKLSTNFSVVPLRLAIVSGAVIAGLGLATALGFVILRLRHPEIAEQAVGWASIVVSVLVLGGLQLLTLGVMGEYIGRMHLNLNNRPQYVLRAPRTRR